MSKEESRKKRQRPWPPTAKERALLRAFLDYFDFADWRGKMTFIEIPAREMLMQFAPPLTHAGIRLATMAVDRAANEAFEEISMLKPRTQA